MHGVENSDTHTLTVDGREANFTSEADEFTAAAGEFETHGPSLDVRMKMNGWQYIGPSQMRHWWSEKKQGGFAPTSPIDAT